MKYLIYYIRIYIINYNGILCINYFYYKFIYIAYYVFSETLLNTFQIQEIIVISYILAGVLVFLFLNKYLYSSYKKMNLISIILLILLASVLITTNGLLTYICTTKINFGVIESYATAIYLPAIALISYFYYKKKLSYKQFIGILFIGLGALLLS